MRTNILLDDKLVNQAFHYTHVKTKRELVDVALREFVQNHSKADLRDLRGKINISDDYDYKALRKDGSAH
jgi:Arc/MetJ family transcription regulator